MEGESEVFGNRSVSGFLEMVGAEEAMTSDQVIWSEQGRLHLAYNGTVTDADISVVEITTDIDGQDVGTDHGIRVGDTIILTEAALTVKCYVKAINVTDAGAASSAATEYIIALPYGSEHLDDAGLADADAITTFVYGSEFKKGTAGRTEGNEPGFKSFTNRPIIMKDFYHVSGSDASQIGWVEVSGEEGQNGYLWYLKLPVILALVSQITAKWL